MKQRRDDILAAVVGEIERRGGTVDAIRPAKGGHRLIYWRTKSGEKLATTVPGYSGDWRSLRHARTNVRHKIREARLESAAE
jgi:hypothetical protein